MAVGNGGWRVAAVGVLCVTGFLCAGGVARAGLVYVNSPLASVDTTQPVTSVGHARYLLSHGNYDQNIHNGVGGVSNSTIASRQLGNVNALTGRAFDFVLENRAGQGLIFTLTAPAEGSRGAVSSMIAWGTFSPTITGELPTIGGVAPGAAFNVISLWARADRAGASMSFENLAFSSGDLAVAHGTFHAGVASRNGANEATGVLTSPGAPVVSAFSSYTQTLMTDGDFATANWTLTGRITGVRDANSAGEAAVAFQIGLSQARVGTPTIPEPAVVGALAGAVPVLMRRR